METLDHKTDPIKLWRTIKAIDGRPTPKAENEAIKFDGSQVTSPKQIANYFNRQFTTSKLGRHTSSRNTRLVSRKIKRKSLTSAVTFTTDQFTKGISNCSNTPSHLVKFRRFGSHPLSPQSRNQTMTVLAALLIGLSRSSVRQRKLWRHSYFQPSASIRRPTRFLTRTLYHFCYN